MNVKTNNPEANQAMPSFFHSIQQSESHPLVSWEYLRSLITSDPQIKNMTELYRQRLQVSKKFADELKPQSPAITISAQMDGYGRKLANFVKPTYLLMVEFDKIPTQQLEHCQELISQDEHTMVMHRSVSGRGLHIFCKYAPAEDDDISILELFELILPKAQLYYQHLLGMECDKACSDITRCAGLAHDPEAYFNWQSVPFELDFSDLKKFYTKKTMEAKYAKRKPKKSQSKEKEKKNTAITIDEAAPHIMQLLQQWGYDFQPGRHNEYILHFSKCCLKYGISQEEAMKYVDKEFGSQYPETVSVLKSCYKHSELFGTWHYYREGEGYSTRPSVKAVKQWLSTHYTWHHNKMTGFYELQSRMVYTGKYPHPTRVDDNIENSLWAEMDEAELHVSINTIHSIINSDFCQSFDPLEDYLKSLPTWQKGKDPDYIDQLADRIHVVEKPGYEHT